MKNVMISCMAVFFIACSGDSKLVARKAADGSKVIIKKGFFSGIDYIIVEKSKAKNDGYKIFYDCACGNRRNSAVYINFLDPVNKGKMTIAVIDTANGHFRSF